MTQVRQKLAAVLLLIAGGLAAQEFRVGSTVSEFTVSGLDGGGTLGVTFISVQCPVSNAYNSRMNGVHNDYASKGVKFVFINSNASDRLGAQATPETFVIDSSGVIRYHGSIDDSQSEARGALDAVLAGKQPEAAETKAFGCSIQRVWKT